MVAPLVAYSKSVENSSVSSWRSGYKQSKPYNLVTPYDCRVAELVSEVGLSGGGQFTLSSIQGYTAALAPPTHVLASAYDRLKNKISDRASLGVSLAELGSTATMITSRALQLAAFGSKLRRGDLVGAARELKMSAVPKRASTKKSFANNYLEFHLGWTPLIKDIGNVIDVLQSPRPDIYVKVRSGLHHERTDYMTEITAPKYNYETAHLEYARTYWEGSYAMGARVSVSNPNLWLANQLGLVNLPGIAIELVPFSFVADWFINLNQFLSQGTDFYGLTLDETWTTKKVTGTFVYHLDAKYITPPWFHYTHRVFRVASIYRQSGISTPGLFVRPFKVWGWRRAAAAVSLVVQQLSKR